MIKYKILVLTDHNGHSAQNSIYAILNEMLGHEKCEGIDIASRGIIENKAFFENRDASNIFGNSIDQAFKYSQDGSYYKSGLSNLHLEDYDIVFMRLPRPIGDGWVKLQKIKYSSIIHMVLLRQVIKNIFLIFQTCVLIYSCAIPRKMC